MMKKLYGFLLLAAALLALCLPAGAATMTSGSWKYETFTGTDGTTQALIVGPVYTTSSSYTVPSTIGGYKVTGIARSAFMNCTNATTITLPNTIRTLGAYAFSYCDKLTNVNIPEGVTAIPDSCFRGSSALTEIRLPESCTTIGSDVLNATNVADVYLGSNCVNYDKYAFWYTYADSMTLHCAFGSQTALHLGDLGYGFTEGERWYRFVANESGTGYDLVLGKIPNTRATSYTVPSRMGGYTVIGLDGTFAGWSQLEQVYLPQTLKLLVDDVFAGCTNLKEITLPDGLEAIGNAVFYDCASLKTITFPSSLTHTTGEQLFERCTSLETFAFPAGFTADSTFRMFYGCTALKSVTLPTTLTDIDVYAFKNCTALTQVTIPSTVTTIGEGAFDTCSSLENLRLPSKVVTIGMGAFNMTPLKNFNLPATVRYIGQRAFNFVTVSNSFSLPEGLISLGNYCFNGAKNMPAYLVLPTTVTTLGDLIFTNSTKWAIVQGQSNENLLSGLSYRYVENNFIIDGTTLVYYTGTKYVSNLVIPENITVIGEGALSRRSIYRITLPEGLTTISTNAFKDNTSMTGPLTLPSTLRTIGAGAFSGSKVKLTALNDGLVTVGANAFDAITGTGNLPAQVYIPRSVSSIGENAFPQGARLIVEQGSAAQIYAATHSHAYGLRNGDFTLSADGTELFEYRGAATEVTVPDGVKVLHAAFHDNGDITRVTLPDGLETIGASAFYYCSALTAVRLPDSVTTMGERVFYGCEALEDMTLPAELKAIPAQAFFQCEKLKAVTVPGKVTSIGEEAFFFTPAVLTLPEHITSIGWDAMETIPNCKAGTTTARTLSCMNIAFNDGNWRLLHLLDANGAATDDMKAVKYIGAETEVEIPATFAEIGSGLFSGTAVTAVTVPDAYTVLPNSCFYNCTQLKSVTLPDNMTTFGDSAFNYCTELRSINWPSALTTIASRAFYRCGKITTIHLPEGVTSLPSDAFATSLSAIQSVIIPKNFTGTLGGITSFKGIYNYSKTYMTVYSATFDPTELLRDSRYVQLSASKNSAAYTAFGKYPGYNHSFYQFEAPTMSSVYSDTGRNRRISWSSATSEGYNFEVYSAHEQLGEYTFSALTYYRNCTLNREEAWFKVRSTYYVGSEMLFTDFSAPMKVDYYTLKTSGTTVTSYTGSSDVYYLPKDFTIVSGGAFANNQYLTELVLHDGVTFIGDGAFLNCTKLAAMTLGRNITTVNGNPFSGCTALTLTVFPDTAGAACAIANNIRHRMMPGSVTLPKVLDLILDEGVSSYQLSAKLLPEGCVEEEITFSSSNEEVASVTDSGLITALTCGECVITASVPSGAQTSFSLTVLAPAVFRLPESITEVLPQTFLGDSSLTYVRIPANITSIGSGAWQNCAELACVYIPATVTSIAPDAFDSCPKLVIYCPAGSTAEAFAAEAGIPCQVR